MRRQILIFTNAATSAAGSNIEISVPPIVGKRQRVIMCSASWTAVGADVPKPCFNLGETGGGEVMSCPSQIGLAALANAKIWGFIGATNFTSGSFANATYGSLALVSRWFDRAFIVSTFSLLNTASTVAGLVAWVEVAEENDPWD